MCEISETRQNEFTSSVSASVWRVLYGRPVENDQFWQSVSRAVILGVYDGHPDELARWADDGGR